MKPSRISKEFIQCWIHLRLFALLGVLWFRTLEGRESFWDPRRGWTLPIFLRIFGRVCFLDRWAVDSFSDKVLLIFINSLRGVKNLPDVGHIKTLVKMGIYGSLIAARKTFATDWACQFIGRWGRKVVEVIIIRIAWFGLTVNADDVTLFRRQRRGLFCRQSNLTPVLRSGWQHQMRSWREIVIITAINHGVFLLLEQVVKWHLCRFWNLWYQHQRGSSDAYECLSC